MKKILAVSDSHGNKKTLQKILKDESFDIAVHLGDSGIEKKWMAENFDYFLSGNNDSYRNEKSEIVIDVEGVKIAMTHGDNYEASIKEMFKYNERVSRVKLVKLCRDIRAELLLYGHSHMKDDSKLKNVRIVNPGSSSYPRDDRKGSYTIITIDDDKKINVEFKFV